MSRGARLAAMMALVALLALAGWRIFSMMQADAALARGDVAGALRWRPAHPEALLGQATQRLAAGDLEAASASARAVLQVEPAEGRGYRVLAQVAAARRQPDRARELFRIAARRAPRDLPTRAWLAQDALQRGDHAEAMRHIDHVLTLSPSAAGNVYPVLVQLAGDSAFREAMADTLRRRPAWRPGLLDALRHPTTGNPANADAVLGALQRRGGLDAEESTAWIESLLRDGRWGEAHARWAAPIVAGGSPLPLLYNGDFSQAPSGQGFDWRQPPVAGAILEYEAAPGGVGRALHTRFLSRRIAGPILEHALLLAPGAYTLEFRRRFDALRSDNGLQWVLACAEQGGPVLARSQPLTGSRGWQAERVAFTLPPRGCKGQWLRLSNSGGSAQLVSGDLWLASMTIEGVASRKAEQKIPRVASRN